MSRRAPTAGNSLQGNHGEPNPNPTERKRRKTRPAGHPDPDAEVVALRPEDLLATGRYICTVCGKGFQRDQNLQLHMRTHNVNWELKKSGGTPARRKAYICPVTTCVYNARSRALSDITGIKKHFNRKHGTKNLICPQCSKPYAVEADLKAHIKNHSLRDYQCECGTTFTRKNSYEAHRAFCCKLLEEGVKLPSSVAGESSSRANADVFNDNFELPDMNEQLVFPGIGFTSYEEAPIQDREAIMEQPNADRPVLVDNQDVPSGHQQVNLSMAMLPDDPDFIKSLPVCLTELLKARYEEIFGALASSGIFGGMVPVSSPPPGANHSMPTSSLDRLIREENGANGKSSTVDFFGCSSSSFMDYGAPSAEESPGLGANLSLSNFGGYGTREENSTNANSAVNNDFFGLSSSIMACSDGSLSTSALSGPNLSLSASFFEAAGKENYFSGNDDPMLASLAFTNSVEQPHPAAGTLTESSATALLQRAGLIGATMSAPSSTCFSGHQVMSSPNELGMNLFQVQQDQNLPLANSSASNLLTLMPNQKTERSRRASFYTYQQQGNRISDPSRSAFQIYQQDKITPNKPASSSFFSDVVKSMDSWSRQEKEKAPAGFMDFLSSSTGKEPMKEAGSSVESVVQGIPAPAAPEPLMATPYTLFSNTTPGNGGLIETGGRMNSADHGGLQAEAVGAPPSALPLMDQNGDGVTMDLLGMGGGEGSSSQFNEQEAAMFADETGGYSEDQLGLFFGGVDGYQRGFW